MENQRIESLPVELEEIPAGIKFIPSRSPTFGLGSIRSSLPLQFRFRGRLDSNQSDRRERGSAPLKKSVAAAA